MKWLVPVFRIRICWIIEIIIFCLLSSWLFYSLALIYHKIKFFHYLKRYNNMSTANVQGFWFFSRTHLRISLSIAGPASCLLLYNSRSCFSQFYSSSFIYVLYMIFIRTFYDLRLWIILCIYQDEILAGTAVYISHLQRQLATKLRTHGSPQSLLLGRINTNTASAEEIIKSISLTIATKHMNPKK